MKATPTIDESRASPLRRLLLRAALSVTVGAPLGALAQQGRTPRVGFLAPGVATDTAHDAFRQGMRDLGWAEGSSYAITWRFAEGRYDRLPALASDLVRQNVDVVVGVSTLCVQAAQKASATLPIVMIAVADPIGEGFAVSLSRPGRNVTGLSNIVTEVSVKHLELLRAVVPQIARVGVLINPQNPTDALVLEQVQGTAYTRHIQVAPVEASTAEQIQAAFGTLGRARADAVIVTADAYFGLQRKAIAELALRQRLPLISPSREMTESGGLMSYGQDLAVHYRRAATYVDRILKGASPAGLPIEQPTVLEFVVNRKTAAAIGLAVPPELLLRADKLIE